MFLTIMKKKTKLKTNPKEIQKEQLRDKRQLLPMNKRKLKKWFRI
jgi:hypothetical protein